MYGKYKTWNESLQVVINQWIKYRIVTKFEEKATQNVHPEA